MYTMELAADKMANTARGIGKIGASRTQPRAARGNQQVELSLRGQRQDESRRAQAPTVAPASGGISGGQRRRDQEFGSACSSQVRAQEVDRHVGARVRDRRILIGMTQQQMAELIGVTHQQAHKYEKCVTRLSAGRLHRIAQALDVQVSYFYEGIENEDHSEPSRHHRMLRELARNFLEIRDQQQQEGLVSLTRALLASENARGLVA